MGINTYCLRAWKWDDATLLDYCAQQRLDAIFLQDSQDPKRNQPEHWAWVKQRAAALGLHLETGGGGVLPATRESLPEAVAKLEHEIRRAKAMGSPLVRCLLARDRAHFPPGPVEQHMETAIALFRAVRPKLLDTGLKIGLEIHKDLQAWEHQQVLQATGYDIIGTYLDTGNPVFVAEHPLTTVELLAEHAVTIHLRDSVVYEHPEGIAVQWVPLGEGTVDFQQILATAKRLAPAGTHIYIKPITGRPATVLPVFSERFWKEYPKARSQDFARFLALAKQGRPYEAPQVVEDLQDRPIPPHFLEALRYQQREHLERSVAHARKKLGLGVRM